MLLALWSDKFEFPWCEHYTPLTANRITILEETFNLEVPIRLPPTKPPSLGLDVTKYCRYYRKQDRKAYTSWRLEVSPDTVHLHDGPLLGFAGERVETKGYMDLMTTFDQGQLSRSFTSQKVAPYPPTKEPTKPHPTAAEDPCDDTFDKSPSKSSSSYSSDPNSSSVCNSVGT
ncbi:hypothetical protein JHK85_007274 [Glycine max]|nr:hypothetical protein JHK85_007274 [Glycine max]KAG5071859.1 hypothetical protein JHK86_007070 [Glycine max]